MLTWIIISTCSVRTCDGFARKLEGKLWVEVEIVVQKTEQRRAEGEKCLGESDQSKQHSAFTIASSDQVGKLERQTGIWAQHL
jgi:hypothetical protein